MLRRHLVYIVTNRSGTLYIGATGNVVERVGAHRRRGDGSFTRRYRMGRLIYFELHADKAAARAREIQLKGWVRRKKIALINESNPAWADLLPVVRELERRRQTLRFAQGP
jgi:putative endonuclease